MSGVNPNLGHHNVVLSEHALAYMAQPWAADKIFPVAETAKRTNSYRIYPESNSTRVLNAKIGSRQEPGLLDRTFTEDSFTCEDQGLADEVPLDSIDNDDDPSMLDLEGTVEDLTSTLMTIREVDVAAITMNPANYATANKAALTTGNGWNNAAVDPSTAIYTLLPSLRRGPNTRLVGVTSTDSWTIIRQNPLLKARVNGGATTDNPADVQERWFASLFGLDEFVVGASFKTATNPGQTDASTRIWGDGFAVVAVNTRPTRRSLHFGTTFRHQQPMVYTETMMRKGLKGVQYCSVRYSEVVKVVAIDAGILITNLSGA